MCELMDNITLLYMVFNGNVVYNTLCIYIVLFIYGEWDNEINCITCHVPKDIVMRVALLLLKMQWILVLFTPNIGVVYLFPVPVTSRAVSENICD